jgi:death-on-curing protein
VSGPPTWLDRRAVLLLHDESLAMFGGAPGLRDEGLLDSALGRPINQYQYDSVHDLASLAAAYGYGIAKNHAFIDGNKRSAFLAIGVFLRINGRRLVVGQVEAIRTILALADGTLDERQLADWIRVHLQPGPGADRP